MMSLKYKTNILHVILLDYFATTAKGASDAADWAISRSLSALLQAETTLSSEGKVDKDGDEDGDESV